MLKKVDVTKEKKNKIRDLFRKKLRLNEKFEIIN